MTFVSASHRFIVSSTSYLRVTVAAVQFPTSSLPSVRPRRLTRTCYHGRAATSSGGLSRDNRTIPECNIDLNSGQIRAAIINYFPRPAPLPGQAGPGGARAGGGDRRHEYLVMQTVHAVS